MKKTNNKELKEIIKNNFDNFVELFFDNLPKISDPEEITIKEANLKIYTNVLEEYFCEKIDYDFYYEDYDKAIPEERKKLKLKKLKRSVLILELGNFLHELIIEKSFFKIGAEIYDLFLGFDDHLIKEVKDYKNVCRIYSIIGYAFYFLEDKRALNFSKKAVIGIDNFESLGPYFFIMSLCYKNGIGVIRNYKKSYSHLLISNSLSSGDLYKDEIDEYEIKLSSKDIIICQENAEVLLANYKKERINIEFAFL